MTGDDCSQPPDGVDDTMLPARSMQAELNRGNKITWGDLCDWARAKIEASGQHPFRHVVVDEAQDFGPRELKFIASLVSSEPRSLYFTGDIGQRIYRWPFSWLSVGIDVRGRSQRLKVNYRTSSQIQHFADGLLPILVAEVDGEKEERTTISVLNGPKPEIVRAGNADEEIKALGQWIGELRSRGYKPNQIAILGRTRSQIEMCAIPAVISVGIAFNWLSPVSESNEEKLSIGTLHAAKGLEFRSVAIIGCDARHLPLKSVIEITNNAEEREIAESREISLFYVGCTRARESLLITCYGQPSPYLARVDHAT
jgi:superfamily I DNA/RNA helicase